MTATILNPAAKLQTTLAKSADTAVQSGWLKFCFDVTLVNIWTEQEKVITVLSHTDRFAEVVKLVRAIEPSHQWEIFETIEQPF